MKISKWEIDLSKRKTEIKIGETIKAVNGDIATCTRITKKQKGCINCCIAGDIACKRLLCGADEREDKKEVIFKIK